MENLTEKEQIKIHEHYISELSKYIEETATILDVNTPATILGKNCIEYWAVLSSASNNAIKKLQQENKELKQSQKQIIVDGVDVKNCKGIDLSLSPLVKCKSLKFKTSDGGIAGIWCSDHTNCYFKQLARKTQEYQKLSILAQEESARNGLIEYELNDKLKQKMQECEELKERNALLESQMAFNLSEMGIRLGNEINRSETLLKELKRFDKIKDEFREMSEKLKIENIRYRKALKEIENVSKKGLNSICYKSNCSRCQCYDGDDCNAGMNSLVNEYFTENSEFVDENSDFIETLEALIESERKKCNKAIPIAQQVLYIINKAKGERNDT